MQSTDYGLDRACDVVQVLFKKGVPLLMPNRSGARGIHTAAAKESLPSATY